MRSARRKEEEANMTEEEFYIHARKPATLRYAGGYIKCFTTQEARIAYDHLKPEQKWSATIKVSGPDGPLYSASQIERLQYVPSGNSFGAED
jgi:hypothetical protein